jgi:hypothetical protein
MKLIADEKKHKICAEQCSLHAGASHKFPHGVVVNAFHHEMRGEVVPLIMQTEVFIRASSNFSTDLPVSYLSNVNNLRREAFNLKDLSHNRLTRVSQLWYTKFIKAVIAKNYGFKCITLLF